MHSNSVSSAFTLRRILAGALPLFILLLGCCWLGLAAGSSGVALMEPLHLLTGEGLDPVQRSILLKLRLPRVLLALIAGAALAVGGLVMQGLLRNPLAEPYILGVSGGAAVGAIGGLIFSLSLPFSMFLAFTGGTGSLLLVLLAARGRSSGGSETLLLSGVMVNAFCSALILFFISMVPAAKAAGVLHWLMGNIQELPPARLAVTLGVVVPGIGVVFILSHRLNLIQLGEDTARSLGLRVKGTSTIMLAMVTLMTSAVVCQTGLLGFVGLVCPHLLRIVLGPDHRVLVPASALGGGAFMVLCDTLARSLPGQGEMPVGVLTAMIGAPLFIFLLTGSRR